MITYVYIQTEKDPPLWTVGFYKGEEWFAESDYPTPEEAAERVRWLYGGRPTIHDIEPDLFSCPVGLALSSDLRPLVVCEDGSVWTGPPGRFLEVEWEECAPIPGTERAHELEAGELEDPEFEEIDQLDLEEELDDLEVGYQGGEV